MANTAKKSNTAKDKPVQTKVPKPTKTATPAPKKSAPTFTVMLGRKSRTFATKAEAKAYEQECRKKTGKAHAIRESRRKPTHKVVSFTAKN